MFTANRAARALAAACLLLLPGCAATALSGDSVFGGTPRPANAPLPDDPPGSFDGVYAGAATDPACVSPLAITNFQVNGERVEFGGFRGPIHPDGTVNIGYAGAWLEGRFEGRTFTGHIDTQNSRIAVTDCLYAVSVQRLGT